MLKSFFLTTAALWVSAACYAQNSFPANGNVGVGTTETSYSPVTVQTNVTKTNDALTKVTEFKTNETFVDNPFKLTVSVNGKVQLSQRSWSLQTGDHGIANDGNLLLQPSGGKIGLGTTLPRAVLDVGRPLSYGEVGTVLARLAEGDNQNSGTNLSVKGFATQLNNGITDYKNVKAFALEYNFYGTTNAAINFYRGLNSDDGSMAFSTNNTDRVKILSNGNVLMGKNDQANSAYKLDVAGSIRANEIIVNTTGADFVFEPAYKLRPLSQLNAYIRTHHHLPEIPSATAMQDQGLEIGEMNKRLLQKVEELTLYLIKKDQQVNELSTRIKIIERNILKQKRLNPSKQLILSSKNNLTNYVNK